MDALVRAAVADRPLEDVVRLITLLESSPEYTRATADALRAAGVDRPVEDVTRLVTLLTKPPRGTDSADEAIRAAAERRPLEDVTRLMQLLHRAPVEPHCGQAAVQAAAAHRPVEELAELIGRLAAERPGRVHPRPEPAAPEAVLAAAETDTPEVAAADRAERPEPEHPGKPRPRKERSATRRTARNRRPARTVLWARGAALLVLLCGVAHVPRQWGGPSYGVLGAGVLGSALCVLLALALAARGAQTRLVAATGAFGVTAALAAGQALAGRFGLPDPSRLWATALAPPWLAITAAATAALAALAVLLAALARGNARRADGG
ncbi:hypothetical protein [Streptomyces sp. NPDC127190]|uniref:hypothetical protein n=1 Tax=unclassified Streptomyces TaxID=2593676 RepID=UPI003639A77B